VAQTVVLIYTVCSKVRCAITECKCHRYVFVYRQCVAKLIVLV